MIIQAWGVAYYAALFTETAEMETTNLHFIMSIQQRSVASSGYDRCRTATRFMPREVTRDVKVDRLQITQDSQSNWQ